MSFTLESGGWYAAEIIGEEFGKRIRSFSPIRVSAIRASGNRSFDLEFYHANYPEGVRDKSYYLQTIERSEFFWLGRSLGHDPMRYLLVYPITVELVEANFNVRIPDNQDVVEWLGRNA